MLVSVEIDLQKVFEELSCEDQAKFMINNVDFCEFDAIAHIAADKISMSHILRYYCEREIEIWLEDNAADYGYYKREEGE